MTFDEIKADKDRFLRLNNVEKQFAKSGYSWEVLMDIGTDYEQRQAELLKIIHQYIVEISRFENVHSYRYRIKSTESLLAKIIRKYKGLTVENYYTEITDLLGIRILYIFKSDYLLIHQQIMQRYGNQKAENIHLKLREGDDQNTYEDMLKSNDVKIEKNNIYRSIHYTFYASPKNITNSPKIEIQTRTIFEEGWSEIDHKLVYKTSSKMKNQLEAMSKILSDLVGTCDSVGSLMKYMENGAIEYKDDAIKDVLIKFLKK